MLHSRDGSTLIAARLRARKPAIICPDVSLELSQGLPGRNIFEGESHDVKSTTLKRLEIAQKETRRKRDCENRESKGKATGGILSRHSEKEPAGVGPLWSWNGEAKSSRE